ncbi:MAG TPA: hypothetical protein VFC67_19290 [Prolixibacteraceae bacterium]|nr:hypothetical protein [Prolixibacteraceae bacterium]
MNINKDDRFDLPPFLSGRTACGINAIIEVFNLQTTKISVCSTSTISSAIMQISNKNLSPSNSVAYQSILLQDIIDEKCRNQEDRDRVMELCEQKYSHLKATKVLI